MILKKHKLGLGLTVADKSGQHPLTMTFGSDKVVFLLKKEKVILDAPQLEADSPEDLEVEFFKWLDPLLCQFRPAEETEGQILLTPENCPGLSRTFAWPLDRMRVYTREFCVEGEKYWMRPMVADYPDPLPFMSIASDSRYTHQPVSNGFLDVRWFREHSRDYVGKWVAVQNGILLAEGSSRDEVRAVAFEKGGPFVVTKVWA